MAEAPQSAQQRPVLAVIGGGIAGLAAAHRLHELAPDSQILVLEASARLGGLLQTRREEGYLVEEAADNFMTQPPWAVELCRRLGVAEQLLPTNSQYGGAEVVRGGCLQPIPAGFALMAPSRFWPIFRSPALSLLGKLRLAREPFVPARCEEEDESIASFARRRLGNEVYERLVEPLVGSIYGSDPAQLSLQATLPRFHAMERTYGSLWRAQRKEAKQRRSAKRSEGGARYSLFTAPREGMSSLVAALADRLPRGAVQLNSPAQCLQKANDGRWEIGIGGSAPRRLPADGLVLATPAFRAAQIFSDIDPAASQQLRGIGYRGGTLVTLGYRRKQVRHPLRSFGFVVPQREQRRLLSASFTSIKYTGRAPEDAVQIRVFLRDDSGESWADFGDQELERISTAELAPLLAIEGQPRFCRVTRHEKSMPLYCIGHADCIARLQHHLAAHRGVELAGAAYSGVGVPHCIRSGEQAAERIVSQLFPERTESSHQYEAVRLAT